MPQAETPTESGENRCRLLAEARSTGIRKIHAAMARNGSPEARFDFDDDRTWFRVLLPIHPEH